MPKKCSKKQEKYKVYVCMICGKKKRSKTNKKIICCDKKMVSEDKGSWNL